MEITSLYALRMRACVEIRHVQNVITVITILKEYGFGSAWLNQSVEDQNKFIVLFERRIKDNFIQHCFADMEASTRCRTYKDIKSINDIEPYLQRDIHSIYLYFIFKFVL